MAIHNLFTLDQSLTLNGGSHTMAFLYGNAETVGLNTTTGDTMTVMGRGDAISSLFDSSLTVNDLGQGTRLTLCEDTNMTVKDFQFDKTGIVEVMRQYTAPTLASDKHGGTMLTLATGGKIDFANDAHLTMAQIGVNGPPHA
jgi:hypothetical protein